MRQQLTRRAISSRRVSHCMLGLIILVLVAGVVGILFSGRIVGSYDYTSGWSRFDNSYHTYEFRPSELPAPTNKPATEDSIRVLETKVHAAMELAASATGKADEVAEAYMNLQDEVKTIREKIDTLISANKEPPYGIQLLLTIFATRIGIAIFVILLVRILISIYRYNMRLAAHYDSKADALALCPAGQMDSLELLCKVFSPAGVDFQESADSIAEHAVDIAKKIVPGRS